MVFSSLALDRKFRELPGLEADLIFGNPTTVLLRLINGLSKPYYEADPVSLLPGLDQTIDDLVNFKTANAKKRVVVLIDGQNFLCNFMTVTGHLRPNSVGNCIKKIMNRHSVHFGKFFVCWGADILGRAISPALRKEIEAIPGLEVVARKPKIIKINGDSGATLSKVDVDSWVIPEISDAYYAFPGLEGLVLVSGDSDYVRCLERTWLCPDKGGPKYVEVISTVGSVAREIRDHPHIKAVLLDQHLKMS